MSAFLTVCAVVAGLFSIVFAAASEDQKKDAKTRKTAPFFSFVLILATVALAYWGGRWA